MSSPARASARAWPLGAGPTAALVLVCIAVGAGGALLRHAMLRTGGHGAVVAAIPPARPALAGDAVWKAGTRAAPGFALHDQHGRLVSLAGQHGHAVLLAFMDSHCKLLCTLEGPAIRRIQGRLGSAARNVRLLVVSVNPWDDTPTSSIQAGERWGFAGPWRWLLGSPAQLGPVWRGYGIEVKQTLGDVTHSSAVYLIDRQGYERAGFNYPFPVNAVARDLRKLAAPAPS
jgi:cytochrome oxidase Cu insertion factor (SCO1/SenC/PrrC family)